MTAKKRSTNTTAATARKGGGAKGKDGGNHGLERTPTGIPGLDKLIGGGITRRSINLIVGGAGSGKSVMCMQWLVDGIKRGENGIYITFEEDDKALLDYLDCFGWNLRKLIAEHKLAILHYTPQQVEHVLEAGGGIVRDTVEAINARRIVIDSLTAFSLLHETEIEQRRAVLSLFDNLRKWDITSFVTSQNEESPEHPDSSMLVYETDAVLIIYSFRKGTERTHGIEVFKVRGSGHSPLTYPLRITNKGVSIDARPIK